VERGCSIDGELNSQLKSYFEQGELNLIDSGGRTEEVFLKGKKKGKKKFVVFAKRKKKKMITPLGHWA